MLDLKHEELGFADLFKIDFDYEYDAPRFFDFTSPELQSEAEEADRWFQYASGHMPSHEFVDEGTSISNSVDCQNHKDALNADAVDSAVPQDFTPIENRLWQKNKPKCPLRPYIPKSPTLMKPTASHLAKLGRPDGQSTTYSGRSPKPTSPLNHPREVCATKRQKLEIKKKQATHLRRQSSLAKKSSKLVRTNSLDSTSLRSKYTTPRGPDLETTQRAQIHRFTNFTPQDNITKSKHCGCKARSVNRKSMPGPLLHERKSAPCLSELQEPHLRTLTRAAQAIR